ncbi:MAG: class I SAM-dependent methyltransferase [Planctomycetes bacterium]|nr:class I SAM-dependent methyltransferase [Planctomycetota bacterium]
MDDLATRQFIELEHRHWWFAGRRALFFDVLRRALAPAPTAARRLRALDVGCGAGGMLGGLAEFADPIGLDISTELLQRARARGFRRLLVGSAAALPVPPASLDLVTAFDCLEHLPDDLAALRSFHAALRPGGHLLLSVPAWQFLFSENDHVAHHQRRYRRGPLVARVEAAGFEVVQASYVNTWLFPLIVPAVLLLKLKQRWLKRRDQPPETNLSWLPPRWLNALLAAIFASERHVLRHASLPLGHSLIVLARRPALPSPA